MSALTAPGRPGQRGVVAVEFAVLLPTMVLLIVFVLLFGRLCWHYTVAQKAAHDAAITLAMASKSEMLAFTGNNTEVAIAAVARKIAETETAQLDMGRLPTNPDNKQTVSVSIMCDSATCFGSKLPNEITVSIQMMIFNVFLPAYTDEYTPRGGYVMIANSKVKYAGK